MMAARSQDPKARAIFERLATEELQHIKLIEAYRKNPEKLARIGTETTAASPASTAPSMEKIAQQTAGTIESLSLEEAIQLGIAKEHEAADFYRECSKNVEAPQLRQLIEGLVRIEQTHISLLTSLLPTSASEPPKIK